MWASLLLALLVPVSAVCLPSLTFSFPGGTSCAQCASLGPRTPDISFVCMMIVPARGSTVRKPPSGAQCPSLQDYSAACPMPCHLLQLQLVVNLMGAQEGGSFQQAKAGCLLAIAGNCSTTQAAPMMSLAQLLHV